MRHDGEEGEEPPVWRFGSLPGDHVTPPPDAVAADSLLRVAEEIRTCFACPRLVAWRAETATARRASFAAEEYWGRPLPGFGDPDARLLVVGLAPAAHGGNRTGRATPTSRRACRSTTAWH